MASVLGVVALAFVLAAHFWPDGFDGPVDADRLAATGDALAAARSDIDGLHTEPGTIDQGSRLRVTCRMGDSVPVGPLLRREWTAGSEANLEAAGRAAVNDMVKSGWKAVESPSGTLTTVSKDVHGLRLMADIEVHDQPGEQRDLTVDVFVDGSDGCTA